jgi:hypothetical protein
MALSAQTFAANVQSKLGELGRVIAELNTLAAIYDARGGAGVFTTAALEDTGFDSDGELLGVIFLSNDLKLFMEGGDPPVANRWPTVHKYRGDL